MTDCLKVIHFLLLELVAVSSISALAPGLARQPLPLHGPWCRNGSWFMARWTPGTLRVQGQKVFHSVSPVTQDGGFNLLGPF